jgi:LUD domain
MRSRGPVDTSRSDHGSSAWTARRRPTRSAGSAYASGAGKVILLVGAQKIVPDLQDALRRIDEYAFPLEDARAQAAYGIHSGVNKVLIINREWTPDRITVVLCDEPLGF